MFNSKYFVFNAFQISDHKPLPHLNIVVWTLSSSRDLAYFQKDFLSEMNIELEICTHICIYTAFSFIMDTQFSLNKFVLCPQITADLKYKFILTMGTYCYKQFVPSGILLAQWQTQIFFMFSFIMTTYQNIGYFNEYWSLKHYIS